MTLVDVILEDIPSEEYIWKFVGNKIYSKWNEYAVLLGIDSNVRDAVCRERH